MKLDQSTNFTLVTGSDFTHANSLFNLLTSIKKYAPSTNVVVYDLGMEDKQLQNLSTKFEYEVRKFDFAKYPAFFNILVNAGQYAWKAPIVEEVANQNGGIVCWMDAGNMIIGPLQTLIDETIRTGFYRLTAGHSICKLTHPGMLDYFKLSDSWNGDQDMLASGCVAFNTTDVYSMALLKSWAKYSKVKDCIAPQGSNRSNHRQDQSLLAILASFENWRPLDDDHVSSVVFHQDIENAYLQHYKRLFRRVYNWMKK